jgi:DNA-binding NtrC family response regulator
VQLGKAVPRIHPELNRYLATYDFPGNVRELKSMVFDAVARQTRGPLGKEGFLQTMGRHDTPPESLEAVDPAFVPDDSAGRFPTLKEAEELLIRRALALAGGNQGVAARYLGITRQGLNKILNRRKQQGTEKREHGAE